MQRDLKIGLSLGVLILGVVSALLFRKDSGIDKTSPLLQSGKQIDQVISERSHTPYMTGDVEFDEDSTAGRQFTEDDLELVERPAHAVPPSWLAQDDEDAFTRSPKRNASKNPLQDDAVAFLPIETRVVSQHTQNEVKDFAEKQNSDGSSLSTRTHVIKAGETLSSIANRYLGSPNRFQEIFDANRQTLADPNRLPLGIAILIPSGTKATSKSRTIVESHAQQQAVIPQDSFDGDFGVTPIRPPRASIIDVQPISPQGATTVTGTSAVSPPVTLPTETAKKFVAPNRRRYPLPAIRSQPQPTMPANEPAPAGPTIPAPAAPILTSPVPTPQSLEELTDLEIQPSVISPPQKESVEPSLTIPVPTRKGEVSLSIETDDSPVISTHRYVVRRGDTLEKIAQWFYGDARRSQEIYSYNRNRLTRPDAIREGMELLLPN